MARRRQRGRRRNSDLVDAAFTLSMRGVLKYQDARGVQLDADVLTPYLREEVKRALPGALADAKQAIEANMGRMAEATFAASMVNAGVRAAKKAWAKQSRRKNARRSGGRRRRSGRRRNSSDPVKVAIGLKVGDRIGLPDLPHPSWLTWRVTDRGNYRVNVQATQSVNGVRPRWRLQWPGLKRVLAFPEWPTRGSGRADSSVVIRTIIREKR